MLIQNRRRCLITWVCAENSLLIIIYLSLLKKTQYEFFHNSRFQSYLVDLDESAKTLDL